MNFHVQSEKPTSFIQVLEDVKEYENTSDGRRMTKLERILLNGSNIVMLVPGGEGPEGATASG